MPEWIDPAWEYWTPADPEVAELLEEAGRVSDPLDRVRAEGFRTAKRGGLEGLRFGRGNPDRWSPPADARERRRRGRCWLPSSRPCVACGLPFTPVRSRRRYCGRGCGHKAKGGKRLLPLSVACAGCGGRFTPRLSASKYCSRACAAREGGRKGGWPQRADPEAFRRGYLAGEKMADLAARLGVKVGALKALRKRLGLPARAPGGRGR